MSTQQDIYAASSESHPPMLNKENYVPWSSRLLRYAKSKPNGKLIHNSILNGPYVRKMIPEPGEEGQVVQRMRKPEWSRHVTIFHQTKDLHTADYTQLYDFLKYNQKEVDELKAERLAKIQDPLALMANSNNPYVFPAPHQDHLSFNQNYLQQPMPNPVDIIDPTTVMNMALALMAKAFKLNYSTPTNNNQRISSNPRNRKIAQPGQNAGNLAGYNDVIGNQVNQNAVQNPRVQNVGNQNGLIGVQGNGNQNQIGNGNLVAARAEGNASEQNGNQIRCYNCRGVGHYDLMAAAADLDEIEEEAAKFVGDFKSLGNEADASLAKHKALKLEIERLLKAVKLESKNVELKFQVLNYARENAHLKATYKNLFDSISVSQRELKQIEADDQAIQTILLGLPEDIYAAEKKAKLFNEWERFTSNEGESIESYYHRFLKLMNDLKRNKHFPEKIASNLKFLNNLQPGWSRHVTIVHQTKDLHTADYTQLYDFLKYNQKENGLIGFQGNGNQNQIGNGNLVAVRAEGNGAGHNRNQIRCYNCRGVGHFARDCTVKTRRRDAAYLQTQLLIAQKEEAGIQLQAEEYDLMAAAADLDEIEEVNANCILMANLQQASSSGTQTDSTPVYDSDGSVEVKDLQLGVKSYQKKLNLTKPDTYRSNLRNKIAYNSRSKPHGIYVDLFKRKRLMRTDELHKFSDGTLNDVQTALYDIVYRLNGDNKECSSIKFFKNCLPKFKYHKEHLCPSCEQGKSKRASHPPKPVPGRLFSLHVGDCYRLFNSNRSIIHRRFNKTPYELINGRKPNISFLHVFGALCYLKNDRENIGKLGAKGDIGFFIGYFADSCAYRVYNRWTKKIMETMNVLFDELSAMAFEKHSSKPDLNSMTSGQISLGLNLTYAPSTITTQQPS
nr:integrase, catalytic region, zinc finger, CCHC-type, peptidase aspartic, catalytic [Tanacetum cinerariifolium]